MNMAEGGVPLVSRKTRTLLEFRTRYPRPHFAYRMLTPVDLVGEQEPGINAEVLRQASDVFGCHASLTRENLGEC